MLHFIPVLVVSAMAGCRDRVADAPTETHSTTPVPTPAPSPQPTECDELYAYSGGTPFEFDTTVQPGDGSWGPASGLECLQSSDLNATCQGRSDFVALTGGGCPSLTEYSEGIAAGTVTLWRGSRICLAARWDCDGGNVLVLAETGEAGMQLAVFDPSGTLLALGTDFGPFSLACCGSAEDEAVRSWVGTPPLVLDCPAPPVYLVTECGGGSGTYTY